MTSSTVLLVLACIKAGARSFCRVGIEELVPKWKSDDRAKTVERCMTGNRSSKEWSDEGNESGRVAVFELLSLTNERMAE